LLCIKYGGTKDTIASCVGRTKETYCYVSNKWVLYHLHKPMLFSYLGLWLINV